jgi:hypothetical protein
VRILDVVIGKNADAGEKDCEHHREDGQADNRREKTFFNANAQT